MKTINRNKIQRMIDGYGTYASGGSGSNGGDMPAGVATQAWTMENFMSIEFFSKLFKAYGPAETEGDPDVEIVPNDVEGEISNIQAMFGFWTEQYISALGQGSGGGGGGGDLNEPLASINTAGLATHPGSAGQTIIWNGSAWVYGSVLNSGVTSVGLSAPTGFNVTGSPITTSGTLALSFASGYELPLAADTAKGVTAYGWGDHSLAGYALASNVYSKTDADAKFLTIAFFRSLFKAYTSASAEVVPNAGDTTTISSIKAMFGFWTEQYISALGQGSGGGGGITLNEPLASLNNASLGSPSGAGQAIVWNGSTWKYSSTAGISTTSLNVGGSASISGALSVAGNISSSAGGFIVSGKDDTYVLLAGGGTKLLSEIGGGGAVNSITIGSGGTNYTPDANGIVTIPSYPSTAHLVSGITVNGGTYTPSSGIVVLPAYPTVPTTISSFTNDSGYITGITSSMVTTALGYTPANAASLTGYLPLTGGTLTGNLQIKSTGSGWVEGIRMHVAANDWCGVVMCGSDNTGDSGTSAKTWSIHNHDGDFFIALNGSNTYTYGLTWTNGGALSLEGSAFTYNTYTVYHSGNFNPANYLPLTGGTLSASNNILSLASTSGSAWIYFNTTINGTAATRCAIGYYNNFANISNEIGGYARIGVNDSGTPQYWNNASGGAGHVFDLIHTGNIGSQSVSSATTATTLATARSLWGQSFNGSADITGNIAVSGNFAYGTHAIRITNTNNGEYATAFECYHTNCATTKWVGGLVAGQSGSNNNAYTINFGYRGAASTSNFVGIGFWGNDNILTIKVDKTATFSGSVTATGFIGELTGDVTGNASTATALQTARTIWGQSFNGTANVDGTMNLTGATGGSGWGEGIRIHTASNGWTTLIFCGTDNTGTTGTSTNSWSFHTYVGNFYINRNGANSHTGYEICNVSGNWGVSTVSPSYKLHVSGVVYSDTGVYSAGYVTALSDIRKKDVKEYMEMDYGIVADAPAIKFVWKDGRCDGKMQVGSIAQYWQRVMPEAVSEMADSELSMSYGVIALLSSIATARKVRDHEQRIAELERENKELKQRLKAA